MHIGKVYATGRARGGSNPDGEEVLQFAVLLMSAGNETTRHTISWGMHALLENEDQLSFLRSRPQGIPLAVDRALTLGDACTHQA